tara:strand:- start:24 stop:161 length:138 start_codon:yes stop_codon:yes gene_type:complete
MGPWDLLCAAIWKTPAVHEDAEAHCEVFFALVLKRSGDEKRDNHI